MDRLRLFVLVFFAVLFGFGCAEKSRKVDQVTSTFDAAKCRTSSAIETEFIVSWEDGTFSVEKGKSPEEFRKDFVTPRVDFIKNVQINQKIQLVQPVRSQVNAMDVILSQQSSDDWGQVSIQAPSLWNAGFKGQNVKVAVVDSVIDVNHPQIRPRIAVNLNEIPGNGIDDDQNGYIDDDLGASFFSEPQSFENNDHGTHVAGIISADPTAGSLSGVAPESLLVPAAFLDGSGGGTLGDAVLALQYAGARGAKIINASWGGTGCSDALGSAFADLSRRGVLLVVAAGNSGADIDMIPFYPAVYNLPGQLTVSASDAFDLVPIWSNTGFLSAHLTAPGVNILSSAFGGGSASMDGTSMASPFVAGAAALLWSAKPQASNFQIREALLRGVDVIPGKTSKTVTRGRLNVQKSLDELRRLVP